jgi:fumarate hydratase class II
MNANEVIATLASRDSALKIHPNDDVNNGQSSNDVIPAAFTSPRRWKSRRICCPRYAT